MTFGEKLSHVAKDDPKFASSVKRIRIASWVFGLAVVVALVFGVWAVVVNTQQATQITKIESPCLKYGAKSEECKEAFEQAVLTITHAQACAILRKAGLEIRPCADARLRQEFDRRRDRSVGGPRGSRGQRGEATVPAGSAHGQQPPTEGVGRGAGKGGSDGPSAPPAALSPSPIAGSPSPSAGSSGGSSGRPAGSETPPPTLTEPPGLVPDLPSTVEAAGGAVGQTTEGVQDVVEETGKTVDCVLRGSCP